MCMGGRGSLPTVGKIGTGHYNFNVPIIIQKGGKGGGGLGG